MTIRLMIADDHELIRAGLTQYFEMQQDIEVVAEATNDNDVLKKLKIVRIDLLLLDMVMPGRSGADLIALIKKLYPDLHILVLSARDELQTVLCAMQAGASGYICKRCSPQALLAAIKEVVATGSYLGQGMAERLAYIAASAQRTDDEIKDPNGAIRLNGKTIREWKEDCEIFYREKAEQEALNNALYEQNIALENQAFDLAEKIRRTAPVPD